jgi:hypothetical protein
MFKPVQICPLQCFQHLAARTLRNFSYEQVWQSVTLERSGYQGENPFMSNCRDVMPALTNSAGSVSPSDEWTRRRSEYMPRAVI